MQIRCPHCQNPIEVVQDTDFQDLTCPSCGSCFNLLPDETVSRRSAANRTLGRFALVERIGIGAFGEVWTAHDSELDRTVAVKIPRKGQLTVEEIEAFLREARSAAQLHHPNIVAVHEVGKEGEIVYIVSDFVKGITLADWLTAVRPTPKEAAALSAKIADAVQHAHDHGVIHRDLKPSNIMLDEDGHPYIMDFGLAKREAGELTMTVDGKVLGTPAYMSPEQAKGAAHDADERSDVYSLGAILFELLTGELPFRGNARMLIHQVINEEAPGPRRLNTRVSTDLDTICLKCLEKDPDRRYQAARELSQELRRFIKGEPITARPVSRLERGWRWCKRNPVVAGLVTTIFGVLLAGVAVSTHYAIRERRQAKIVERNVQDLTLEKAWSLPEQTRIAEGMLWMVRCLELVPEQQKQVHEVVRANLAAWHQQLHALRATIQLPKSDGINYDTDQGPQVIFVCNGSVVVTSELAGQIHLRNAETLQQQGPTLFHDGRVHTLVPSPKDDRIFLSVGGKAVKLWNADTCELVGETLLHEAEVLSACFSADGGYIVTGCEDGKANLWDASNHRMTSGPFLHEFGVTNVAFAQDGSHLLTTDRNGFHLWNVDDGTRVGDTTPYDAQVFSLQVSPVEPFFIFGSQDQTVRICSSVNHLHDGIELPHPEPVHSVAFSADGREILTGCRDGKARRWERKSGRLIGSTMNHALNVCSVAFSPGHSAILTASTDGMICLWDIPSPRHYGPLRQKGMIRGVAFSPDGKYAVTASSDGVVQEWETDTLEPFRASIDVRPRKAYCAAYSPDGSRIAIGHSDGVQQWDRSTAEWVGPPFKPCPGVLEVFYSPDGKRLLTAGGKVNVWRIADGRRLLNDKSADAAVFSHDGTRVLGANYSKTNPTTIIWHVNEGTEVLRLPDDGTIPWAVAMQPDGSLFATGTSHGLLRIWDSNTREVVTSGVSRHESSIRRAVFTPDGKQIVTASHDRTARIWDVVTGRTIGPPLVHSGPVKAVAISPDGTRVLTGDGEGEAWIWDQPPQPIDPNVDVDTVRLWVQVETGMELVGGKPKLLSTTKWHELASQLQGSGFPEAN